MSNCTVAVGFLKTTIKEELSVTVSYAFIPVTFYWLHLFTLDIYFLRVLVENYNDRYYTNKIYLLAKYKN